MTTETRDYDCPNCSRQFLQVEVPTPAPATLDTCCACDQYDPPTGDCTLNLVPE